MARTVRTREPLYAKDLRKGDKINGHEDGWLTVLSVKKTEHWCYNIEVLVSGMNGEKMLRYEGMRSLDIIRNL